jgi:hypothetical protein
LRKSLPVPLALAAVTALTLVLAHPAAAAAEPGAVTVFLNGGGALLRAGRDRSSEDRSALLYARGLAEMEIPAFRGGARRWNQVVQCVRDGFSPFAIDVVTERPAAGTYIMAMVGGRPGQLGYGRGISGVAPWNGDVISDAVVFVFEQEMRGNPQAVCASVLHEVGHALGLEHAYLCEDPMSYLSGCGKKSFQDQDAWCGEGEPRECERGGTQNSFRHLAAIVGLRGGGADGPLDRPFDHEHEHEHEDEHEPEDRGWDHGHGPGPGHHDHGHDHGHGPGHDRGHGPGHDRTPERRPPRLDVLSPRADLLSGNAWVEIAVRAAGSSEIADVELVWATPERNMQFRCSAMPRDVPVRCERRRDLYVFSLAVGVGPRAFAVRAVDRAGNATVSATRQLWFDDPDLW